MPADLTSQPFILFETGSITRRLVDEFFTRERIEAEIVMETENVEIIKAMVRSGLGHQHHPVAGRGGRRARQAAVLQPHRRALADRQTGWLYPKMSRLPRAVSEVMRVFEQIRPAVPGGRARPAKI